MTTSHPLTPPPDLVQQWDDEATTMFRPEYQQHLTARAAQWGSDQELEACCEWLRNPHLATPPNLIPLLRATRRPQPPQPLSLKRQALDELEVLRGDAYSMGMGFDAPAIRRALEELPND